MKNLSPGLKEELRNIAHLEPCFPGNVISHTQAGDLQDLGLIRRHEDGSGYWVLTDAGRTDLASMNDLEALPRSGDCPAMAAAPVIAGLMLILLMGCKGPNSGGKPKSGACCTDVGCVERETQSSCTARGGFFHGNGSKCAANPCGTVPPGGGGGGGGGRMPRADMQARQKFTAQNVGIHPAYFETKAANAIALGAKPRMNGITVNPWVVGYPAYCYYNGDAATKAAAAQYARDWLKGERDDQGGGWRNQSQNCSLNHQMWRQSGIFLFSEILGPEALKYGDPAKVRAAKSHILDILTGRAWWDPWGGQNGPPCDGGSSAGDHPEGWRSRHYASRIHSYLMALADMAQDPEVARTAAGEMDKLVAHLRLGVRPDGLWDEKILPHFRADTGTRCPQYCQALQRQFGLTCGPMETPQLAYILFPKVADKTGKMVDIQWRPEWDGNGSCKEALNDNWIDYPRFGGTKWHPLLVDSAANSTKAMGDVRRMKAYEDPAEDKALDPTSPGSMWRIR